MFAFATPSLLPSERLSLRPRLNHLACCTANPNANPNPNVDPSVISSSSSSSTPRRVSRRAFLSSVATASASLLLSRDAWVANADDADMVLKTVTAGKGVVPKIGDLVGVRFKGVYNGVVFDNLFDSTEPYFYRVGAGAVLQGIDEAVLQMSLGQVVEVSIPPAKAFGTKGRRASAGKPSIPPNATVFYTIELTTIPGKEDELLESLDDAEIGTSI